MRRVEEAEEVVLELLEELLEELPLPVAAPLAPSKTVRAWKKNNFCAPDLISSN